MRNLMDLTTWSIGELDSKIRINESYQQEERVNDPIGTTINFAGLADLWGHRFKISKDPEDLNKSLVRAQLALNSRILIPDNVRPTKGDLLATQLKWLEAQAHISLNDKDWDEVLRTGEQVLDMVPYQEAYWWSAFTSMSYGFLNRYSRQGDTRDLRRVINTGNEAIHNPQHRRFLNYEIQDCVANAYHYKAQIDGCRESIESALSYGFAALHANRDPTSVKYHGSVTGYLLIRYSITRESGDLEEGLRIANQALPYPKKTTYGMITVLHNHASFLLAKHERFSQQGDDEGISLLDTALKSVKDGLSLNHWAALLNLRGRILSAKFAATRNLEHANGSIESLQEALAAISKEHPSYLQFNTDIAHAYAEKYRRLFELKRPEEAIEALEDALAYATLTVAATENDATAYAERNNNLATLYAYKSMLQQTAKEKAHCMSLAKDFFCRAVNAPNSPPRARIDGAHKAGRFLLRHEEWEKANEVLKQATDMLPKLASATLTSQDQQEVLRITSGMATAAAEAALHVGRPAWESIQRLEAARCLVSEMGMKQRDDLRTLMEKYPSQATRYKDVRNRVAQYSRFRPMNADYLESRDEQDECLKEADRLEKDIRRLPGFERFQLPMSEDDLKAIAEDGPVIAINIGQKRSDALIVKASEIVAIPLEILDTPEVRKRIEALSPAETPTQRFAHPRRTAPSVYTLEEQLLWLWQSVVAPALKVALEDFNDTSTKRVWWLTSGLLGGAPFHLAGDQATNNTFDHCVSSYTSSCKALKYAREKAHSVDPKLQALLVTMPTSPSPYRPLSTTTEKRAIKEAFGREHTELERRSVTEVIRMLSDFPFVHLACHGVSIHQDPARSGVVLYKDDNASEVAVLTVSTLEKLHLNVAYLAYLSACSTAEIGDGALRDESIHLTNSFQMIGFPHVIGSIWPADDTAAGEIALGFYKKLFVGGNVADAGHVAKALHESMLEYRKRENNVAKWGPFVHVGV